MGSMFRNFVGIFRLMRDSKGVPSWAHTLSVPFVILTMIRWLIGGIDLTVKALHLIIPAIAASDAALILGVWLAYLGTSQITDKKMNGNGNGNGGGGSVDGGSH